MVACAAWKPAHAAGCRLIKELRPVNRRGHSCKAPVDFTGQLCLRVVRLDSGRLKRQRSPCSPAACLILTLASTTMASAAPSTAATISALLSSISVLTASVAAAIFLLSAVPALLAMARAANRAEAVLRAVEKELPDTAAMMRLSGLEVTECISELSSLGTDLSKGVQSTARLITLTEQNVRQGAVVAEQAIKSIGPNLAKSEQAVRDAVEVQLRARAELGYTKPVIAQVASATTRTVGRLRVGLMLASAVGIIIQAGRSVQQRAQQIAVQNHLARRAFKGGQQ